jgi:energy-coupling factor transporter transmembrane protein EcfT
VNPSALDPRVGVAAAAAAWAVALATPRPATAAWVALLALLLRLARPRALRALWLPAAIALFAAVVLAIAGRRPDAVALGARILSAGWIGSALIAWLPLEELLGALAWARVPPALLEIVAVGDRQRHALGRYAGAVLHAQRLRLGWATPPRALRSAGALAGLAVWRAVEQAETASEALALRGARGHRAPLLRPVPGWRNGAFAALSALALGACVLLPRMVAT